MGKKYIVEIGRLERLYKVSTSAKGMPNMTWLSPEVDLTPYTEPDLERVRMVAYADGYKTAKVQCDIQAEKDMREVGERHYQRGLADAKVGYENGFENGMIVAWDAAKKIALMDTETSENVTGYFGLFRIMENMTPMQAIEKIRQYEQEQKEFHVGDEFENGSGKKFVVLKMDGKEIDRYIDSDGKTYLMCCKYKVMRKTGRHFPEISTVLEKMRGEQK